MMASHNDSEEEQFFDTPQDTDSVSDLCSDRADDFPTNSSVSNPVSSDFSYEFWTRSPESIHDRRRRFFEQMGLCSNENRIEKEEAREELTCNEIENDMDRMNLDSGAVLRNSSSDYSLFSRRSSMSCSSTEEDDLSEDFALDNNLVNKVRDLDITRELNVGAAGKIGILSKLVKTDKFQKSGKNNMNNWLMKLRQKVQTADPEGETKSKDGAQLRRTRVCSHKKRMEELSSLYEGQVFCAHEGLILAMQFSPDGRFLASAGEDGVIRVWKVIEDERENAFNLQAIDPSSLYFSVNHSSRLVPLDLGKDKKCKERTLKKPLKPGCVILPPKVFRIAEEPLHEFRGHCGEVLALSWSSNERLLSSSVDKTVRLWQVGHDECLRVFSHNNYVTCVEFNPVDNNYFISGSIDGKVRIWDVCSCRVVDWVDIIDIVTAVCFYPSGKRGIVGSMDGSCRFYDIIDNQLQLDTQIFLPGKKKLPCKRITGFQFSPSDSSKVLVTSADSQIRILSGSDVIFKLKGPRTSGSHVTASFTEDGKHIISGSEDSNIHVWDQSSHNTNPSKAKSSGSRESFVSKNSSIAIPWWGVRAKSTSSLSDPYPGNDLLGSILGNVPSDNDSFNTIPSSSADCFSLGRGIFMESWPKGPATWPEEKLVDTYLPPSMGRSEFNILKAACESMRSSHMWGLVIVTGGHDGRIRTYYNYGLPIQL